MVLASNSLGPGSAAGKNGVKQYEKNRQPKRAKHWTSKGERWFYSVWLEKGSEVWLKLSEGSSNHKFEIPAYIYSQYLISFNF